MFSYQVWRYYISPLKEHILFLIAALSLAALNIGLYYYLTKDVRQFISQAEVPTDVSVNP